MLFAKFKNDRYYFNQQNHHFITFLFNNLSYNFGEKEGVQLKIGAGCRLQLAIS